MSERMDGPAESAPGDAVVSVRNVGGIDECELEIRPGVTVLTGRNATNRTSLLTALSSVLGGSVTNLKSDADRARIELTLDGETYVREFERTAGGVTATGDAYTDEDQLVDLFVTLLGDNPARRAVETGADLREIIMRPVDTEAIEDRVASLREAIDDVEETIGRVEDRRSELPALERRRRALREEIEATDADLRSLRAEVAEHEAAFDADEGASELVEELEAARDRLNGVEADVEVAEAGLEALREELADLRSERADLPEAHPEERDRVDRDLRRARERKSDLGDTVTSLTSIVELNRELLTGEQNLPGIEPDGGDVTAALAPDADREVTCWTCGSRVNRGEIRDRLEDLADVIEEKREAFKRTRAEVESLVERREELDHGLERREELDRRIDEREDRIDEREGTLADLRAEAADLRETIGELEAAVADSEDVEETALLDRYERIGDLEYRRGQLEERLADVEGQIDEIEALPDTDALRAQRDEVRAELAEERDRIETLESEAVDAFNTHMDELLGHLAFDNVARVWIERKRSPGTAGGGGDTSFDLHVVRRSSDGVGHEDAIDHLSESEREVIGLVFALAGYLVHDVHETVPFLLLDSLEAIDAERIRALVDYFAAGAHYLLVALLPEDAAALSDRHDSVPASEIGS